MGDQTKLLEALDQYVRALRHTGINSSLLAGLAASPDAHKPFLSLVEAIESHPIAGGWSEGIIVSAAGGRWISPRDLAEHLSGLVLDGRGASEAVSALIQFMEHRATDVLVVQCLHGVTVQRTIQLSETLSIEPPDNLLHTEQKARVFGYNDLEPDRPSAALVYRWRLDQAFRTKDEHVEHQQKLNFGYDNGSTELTKAFAAIVACGIAVEQGAKFWQYTEPGYPQFSSAISLSTRRPNLRSMWFEIDAKKVATYFDLAERFAQWPNLARLISRLGRARVSHDHVDSHIDYGIIAESLLTHSDGQTSEIAHRLSTRAAWFLGEDADGRRIIAEQVRKLYRWRSNAAHAGVLSSKWSPDDRLRADEICTALIRKTLERGAFVNAADWPAIIFG